MGVASAGQGSWTTACFSQRPPHDQHGAPRSTHITRLRWLSSPAGSRRARRRTGSLPGPRGDCRSYPPTSPAAGRRSARRKPQPQNLAAPQPPSAACLEPSPGPDACTARPLVGRMVAARGWCAESVIPGVHLVVGQPVVGVGGLVAVVEPHYRVAGGVGIVGGGCHLNAIDVSLDDAPDDGRLYDIAVLDPEFRAVLPAQGCNAAERPFPPDDLRVPSLRLQRPEEHLISRDPVRTQPAAQ